MTIPDNPELVRHWRAQLRFPRTLLAVLAAFAGCAVVVLAISLQGGDVETSAKTGYFVLVGAQYVLLGAWTASACGQAIAQERETKTFDFWRTTRLTPTELLVGLLFGRPALAALVVGSSLPVSVAMAILGGVPVRAWLGTYLMLAVFGIFSGLFGLWASMLSERSSSGGATGLILLGPVAAGATFLTSPWPGLGAISIAPVVTSLHGAEGLPRVSIFGMPASYLVSALLIYPALAAWLAVMLVRNLKRDLEDVRLLSRWQAIGLVAFVNVLFYAFLSAEMRPPVNRLAVGLNILLAYIVGLFTLTPRDRLQVWWRGQVRARWLRLSEDGLSWPWLVVSVGVAYIGLASGRALLTSPVAPDDWTQARAALHLLVALVFVARDVLFLQWARLTQMKQPVAGAIALLVVLYLVVVIVGASVSGRPGAQLLPWGGGDAPWRETVIWATLQLPVIALLLYDIARRLDRPARLAVSEA